MSGRKKLVAGNWKMNGGCIRNAVLLEQLRDHAAALACDVAVFPPFPYLAQAQHVLQGSDVGLGGQTLSEHPAGAFTGEVSAAMLLDVGCRYVLVGHSERRALFGEGDQQVAEKFLAACKAGLVPVLCVGETLVERQAGNAEEVVFRQLASVIGVAGLGAFASALVAYEPVWAIGTGVTATPEQAQAMHAAIRQFFAVQDAGCAAALRILYGGSVKPDNAAELFAQADIDGGLIGGASLQAEDFLAICQAVH